MFNQISDCSFPKDHKIYFLKSRAIWFFVLVLSICLYFASILGLNYSPINDAWVLSIRQDADFFTWSRYWKKIRSLNFDARFFRAIPYVLASEIEINGFYVEKIFLFLINVMTGLGVYLLTHSFFRSKRVFSSIVALVYYFFSFDGTMFWLGAFGVNISLFATVYSLYFFNRSLLQKSPIFLAISCLLLVISFMSYVGAVIFIPAFVCIMAVFWVKNWKSRFIYFVSFAVAFLIGNLPMALEFFNSRGRVSVVADASAVNITEKISSLLSFYSYKIPKSLFNPDFEYLIPSLILGALSFLIFMKISKGHEETRFTDQEVLWVVIGGLTLIVAGFVPYSLSDLRIDGQRTMMYSRSGYVLACLVIGAFSLAKLTSNNHLYKKYLSLAGSILLVFIIQDKAAVAQVYDEESYQVRKFLSEVTKVVPKYEPGSYFLIYIEPGIFSGKAMMVINRPTVLLRYLYEDPNAKALTISDFYIKRDGVEEGGDQIKIRRTLLDRNDLITLRYSQHSGISPLLVLPNTGAGNTNQIKLPGLKRVVDSDLTDRQNWFVKNTH